MASRRGTMKSQSKNHTNDMLAIQDTASSSQKNSDNPFQIPETSDVFRMRETEKQKAKETRDKFKRMTLWEKAQASSNRPGASLKANDSEESRSSNRALVATSPIHTASREIVASGAPGRRMEKENLKQFVAKKREIFLVQMSLDTKREEIRKLEDQVHQRENALMQNEQMLEEDAARFDTFLKENDKKSHDAIKRAELETKLKQEKLLEIKQLNSQIYTLSSEMSALKEQLEDCLKYKAFLKSITPSDWIRKHSSKASGNVNESKTEVSESKFDESKVTECDSDSEDDLPMYFQNPQQLLDIFAQLEEKNLFLIQNSQETEQALEELKQEFRDTRNKMDPQTKSLVADIGELDNQIKVEHRKASTLESRMKASGSEDTQEAFLRDLNKKVVEVYQLCGFDADASISTLSMLTDLESQLEDLQNEIDRMPRDFVAKALKQKEKERRDRVRIERLAAQQQAHEERLRKSAERSMQGPTQKAGKPVMFRSVLPEKSSKKSEAVAAEAKRKEMEEFFEWND